MAGFGYIARTAPTWQFAEPLLPDPTLPPSFETVFSYASPEGMAHAPAILPGGPEGEFALVWFDGIREGHNDKRILGIQLPGGGAPQEVLTRHTVSDDMVPAQTVLTLGNTIGNGKGGLFATTVSLGGWAAASITHLAAEGGQISEGRRLNLSPLLARSHLVKSPVVAMNGAGVLLPAYFEMGSAYGVAARLDGDGRVRGVSDMRGAQAAIQPMVVTFSDTDAVAILRNFSSGGGPLLASWSEDGGQSWSAPEALDLPNPSAPVAAVRLSDGRALMVFNDALDRSDTLTFAHSGDQGRTWTRGAVLGGDGNGNLRYPMMHVLGDGRIALTYSLADKAGIAAHIFTESWAVPE
jgi:predicted neuraminidase